ncbi:hypothetical protein MAAFP003_1575 [Mycobacterium ahvazicum]|uniref:Uncharacterized protein n=1 Tax=Mycobacterium ahvazicum TaxID=1964395 RepID=A0A2K4Y828_9MYCO|nr:hypothetical protein [Mycobacterium ahvazicum]SOX52907.1 hypothetical protein MAAFP003_1575 [Mycobacterium ahvazicum]
MTTEASSGDRVTLLRQLATECLQNYVGGFAELEQLDRDLKSIIRTLSDIANPSWTKTLRQQWGQLEIIYALALAEGRFQLSPEEETDVQGIVAELITAFRDSSP